MAIEIKIPSVGESITEVQIAEWLKKDGDAVKKDENIAVLDSEKTTLELAAPEAGRLKIMKPAGEILKIGEIVAMIEAGENGKVESAKPKTESKTEKKNPAEKTEEKKLDKVKTEEVPGRAAEQTPIVKKIEEKKTTPMALEQNFAAEISDSETPESAARAPDAGEKIVPMTMLRRTAARRLVEAKLQMAMLTTFNEVDVSAVQALRKEFQESFEKRHDTKLGFMSFFVKAVAEALKQFPQLNAEIRGNDIVYHASFDIGVAIASERGLVVPILRNAGKMSFAEIEKGIGDFARRAKEGKLKPQELEKGTFTITNGGVFGSLFSTPILNPPQTGILGMHTIQERPVAVKGEVVIRPMMYVALTYDHRLVDGREAVLFLTRVKEMTEKPARMLIEI